MNLKEGNKLFLQVLAQAQATAEPKLYSVSATSSAQGGFDKVATSGIYKKDNLKTVMEDCFRNLYQGTFKLNKSYHPLQDSNTITNGYSCHPMGDLVVIYTLTEAKKEKFVTILYIGNHSNCPYYRM